MNGVSLVMKKSKNHTDIKSHIVSRSAWWSGWTRRTKVALKEIAEERWEEEESSARWK